MSHDRRTRLWNELILRAAGEPLGIKHVCAAAAECAGVDGAAVTVLVPAAARQTVCATDGTATDLADLTQTIGEGPGVDSLVINGPVFATDVTGTQWRTRWPIFAPAVAQMGIGAVFSLPLQVGGIKLGVLDMYRRRAGGLVGGQLMDALALADVAFLVLLLAGRNESLTEQGGPDGLFGHPEVHQATGMVMVQLGVTAPVALIRLRAYAYLHDRRLRDVAGEVIAKRLCFTHDLDGAGGH